MVQASRMGFEDILRGIIMMVPESKDQVLQMKEQRQWRENTSFLFLAIFIYTGKH